MINKEIYNHIIIFALKETICLVFEHVFERNEVNKTFHYYNSTSTIGKGFDIYLKHLTPPSFDLKWEKRIDH